MSECVTVKGFNWPIWEGNHVECGVISYLGMKSWDLHVYDCESTITHVDRVKKSNPWYKNDFA